MGKRVKAGIVGGAHGWSVGAGETRRAKRGWACIGSFSRRRIRWRVLSLTIKTPEAFWRRLNSQILTFYRAWQGRDRPGGRRAHSSKRVTCMGTSAPTFSCTTKLSS